MKKYLSLFLSLIILSSSTCIVAYADDYYNTVPIYLTQEELEEDPADVIEKALDVAKNNANFYNRYVIYVPSGEYLMSKPLHIYSYTTLVSQVDSIYYKDFESGNMLKCGKNTEEFYGYDGYTSISIQGGVWDNRFYGDSCGMRFGHCNNVSVTNLSILNVQNNHHIEMAAASDVNIQNCYFAGYTRNQNTTQEAVQIDIIHSSAHFPDYSFLDDTPCKNISVSYCTFENVFAGVGTRSGVIGSYFDNINISNNTFVNVTNKAITCFNYTNSTITNNIIDGASVGVFFEYYPTKNLTSTFFKPNNSAVVPYIINDCNTVIANNAINVNKKASYATSCGIGVYGGKLSNSSASKNNLIAGSYVINNLRVENNAISLYSPNSHGINLKYVQFSQLSGNVVTDMVSRGSGYYQLNLSNSIIDMIGIDEKFTFMTGGKKYNLYNISVAPKVKSKNHYAELTWNKVSNATGYKIYKSTTKAGPYELIKTVKSAKKVKYTDKKVKKKKTYYYKIVAYKAANSCTVYGKYSGVKKVKIK